MSPYFLVAICVISLVIGQLLFKAISGEIIEPFDIFRRRDTLLKLSAAVILYGSSTIAWIIALRTLPLSQAYLFNALTFVLVPVAAFFYFHEVLEVRFFIGSAFIIAGIIIASS